MTTYRWPLLVTFVSVGVVMGQSEGIIKKNQQEKGYSVKGAAAKAAVWSDKGYAITLLPPELKGALMIVRPAGSANDWIEGRDYTANADCTTYLAVRSEFNGATIFKEEKAKKLIAAGWAEVDESFRTNVPKDENWKWRLFKKDLPKGKVEVKVEDLKLDAMTVFFFVKKK